MTLGQKKLEELIKKISDQGETITPEQEIELEALSKEIDRLYEIVLTNQAAFGVLWPKEEEE